MGSSSSSKSFQNSWEIHMARLVYLMIYCASIGTTVVV